jgi:ribose transport system substrate-binding protein
MPWLKRLFPVLIASTLIASLAACGPKKSEQHYYLVANNTHLAYWQSAAAGLAKIAAQSGVRAEMRGPANFDPKAEAQAFQDVVALRPAGIMVSVVDETLMTTEINDALAAGIPVITLDSDAPHSRRLFFIGTNNRDAGRLGGQALAENLKGKGNVVIYTIPGQPNLDERLEGYNDILAAYPNIHVTAIENIHGEAGIAAEKTRQYMALTGKKHIDAFVCLEASAGEQVGAVASSAAPRDRPVIIAMDVDRPTLDLVKSGIITATVAQKPFTMAYIGVQALQAIQRDPLPSLTHNYEPDPFAPIPAFIDTGSAIVNGHNVDLYLHNLELSTNH